MAFDYKLQDSKPLLHIQIVTALTQAMTVLPPKSCAFSLRKGKERKSIYIAPF